MKNILILAMALLVSPFAHAAGTAMVCIDPLNPDEQLDLIEADHGRIEFRLSNIDWSGAGNVEALGALTVQQPDPLSVQYQITSATCVERCFDLTQNSFAQIDREGNVTLTGPGKSPLIPTYYQCNF